MSSKKIIQAGQALNAYVLPPLPEFPLPALPLITDKSLYLNCITHTSTFSLPRRVHDFDMTHAGRVEDYEKLEHVGDGLLGGVVTVLLHELYPNLREGPATTVKDHLVCNATLAQLSDRYGITDLLIAAPSALYVTRDQQKTKGSLFESWVAGVYYSYRVNGGEGESWPKPIELDNDKGKIRVDATEEGEIPLAKRCTSPSLLDESEESGKPSSDDILANTLESRQALLQIPSKDPLPQDQAVAPLFKKAGRTHGEAFQHIYTWLSALLTPVAHFALEAMQIEQKRLFSLDTSGAVDIHGEMGWQEEDRRSTGAKSSLNVYAMNKWDTSPTYSSVRAGEGLWKVICEVKDADEKMWVGEGIRNTKKFAGALAAYKICHQIKLIK